MIESPLNQVRPTSLEEVFNKDPTLITTEERAIIVAALREDRARWLLGEKNKKKTAVVSGTKLEDLGL